LFRKYKMCTLKLMALLGNYWYYKHNYSLKYCTEKRCIISKLLSNSFILSSIDETLFSTSYMLFQTTQIDRLIWFWCLRIWTFWLSTNLVLKFANVYQSIKHWRVLFSSYSFSLSTGFVTWIGMSVEQDTTTTHAQTAVVVTLITSTLII
jgi:hypothetical protein